MTIDQAYKMCCKYKGRMVDITTRDGKVHRGIIQHVDHRKVYIQPADGRGGYGGFGWGFGWGFGPGLGIGIGLGTILGVAISRPFFW